MKPRTTLFLLIFAAGLFAFIKFYESKQPGTREAAEKGQYVVSFDSDKVTGIDIANKEDRIELRKQGSDWFLERPVKDRADSSAVEQLLSAIEYLKKDTALDAKSDQMKEFGLTNSQLRVRVICPGGPPEILLGNDAAVDGKTYLGIDRSNTVYVVDSSIKAQLSKKADDLRDRRLTPLDGTLVDKFSIKTAAGLIEAEKLQGHWQLRKPINARGDDQKINDLIAQIVNTRIDTFVPGNGNPVAYGLEEPALTVTLFTTGAQKPEVLDFGRAADKEKVYARLESRNGIYLLSAKLEDALGKKPDDLRDRHLLRINFDIVDRINIEPAGKEKIVLARKQESWVIKSLGDRPANSAAAGNLSSALQEQMVTAFVADVSSELAKYGLDKPQVKVTFSSYASENTPESTAGERPIETVAFGKFDGDNVYARLEGEPFIVSVNKAVLDSIFTHPAQWQDLAIFKLKPEEISSIDVIKPGQPEIALERGKGPWKLTKGEGPVNETNVQSFCNTLASLHAVRWLGSGTPIQNPELSLTVFDTRNKRPFKLTIGKENGQEMWDAAAEGLPGTFILSKPDVEALQLTLAGTARPSPAPQPLPPAPAPSAR